MKEKNRKIFKIHNLLNIQSIGRPHQCDAFKTVCDFTEQKFESQVEGRRQPRTVGGKCLDASNQAISEVNYVKSRIVQPRSVAV